MHEQFPECPICGSDEGYTFSGFFSEYFKCPCCDTKWKLVKDKGTIKGLMLHELPKDGSSVYTIKGTEHDGEPLYNIIGEDLSVEFWKELKLDEKINWEFLSGSINIEASKVLILDKGEKLLHQWAGQRKTLEEFSSGGNTHKYSMRTDGLLLLSTRKLYWIKMKKTGFFNKKFEFQFAHDIPLVEIRGITGETGDSVGWFDYETLVKKFCIVDSSGENKFLLRLAFLETFKPIVQKAIELRQEELESEKKKQRLHFVLDFSFLKDYMKKGGLVMQVLKCPECGGKIQFPESGKQINCSYCGHTIYAQDIFEKVKLLLE